MAMPISRDITQATDTPIPASIINTLQDMIIGAKHPELEFGIPAHSFVGGGTLNVGGGQITFAGAAAVGAALDFLRAGDRITTILYTYNVGGAGSIQMRLCRRKNDGTVAEVIAQSSGVDTDATGAAIETNTLTYNHLVASGYSYFLRVDVTNAANVLLGATLKKDRL